MEKWILIYDGKWGTLPNILVFDTEFEALMSLKEYVKSEEGLFKKINEHHYISNGESNDVGIKKLIF